MTAALPLPDDYRIVDDPRDPICPFSLLRESERPRRPAPAARPAARPTPPAPPAFHLTGRWSPFGVASAPLPWEGRGYVRFRLRAGCLDRTLTHATAGRWAVPLLVDHDPGRVLASTADRTLDVWAMPQGVYFAVLTAGAAGRCRATGLRAVSAGFAPVRFEAGRDDRGHVVDVLEAVLTEVSLVPSAAFPDSFIA